jgi:ABC-type protease/lipase transport system fused ATPase/permease subunit
MIADPSKAPPLGEDFDFDFSQLPPGIDVFELLGRMLAEQPSEMSTRINEMFATLGDSMINQMVVSLVNGEYEALGVDPANLQTDYIVGTGGIMLLIALVGPTGAGKTTMVKLLMRFYDVIRAAILVDGHNIKDFRREDLRCMFGMVLQDTWLYNDTIMENIRHGQPSASDEDVIAAAKAAHVDHFVRTLPEGHNLVLNEEATNISQGQKQLLTIARAIVINPSMLILDEATSSVDTRTEVLIQQAMDKLMENRTSFIIAHRLSTIRNADWILVMDEGDIVEQGKHEGLLERNGFYAELYNSQFERAPVNA